MAAVGVEVGIVRQTHLPVQPDCPSHSSSYPSVNARSPAGQIVHGLIELLDVREATRHMQ
jgi:hypothetical protein